MLALLAIAPASLALGQEDGETTVDDAAPIEPDEAAATSPADHDNPPGPGNPVHNRRTYLQLHPETDTLTDHWFGLGDDLRNLGITTTLNLWVIYQANVDGGLATDDEVNGEYRFATHFDLERLVDLPGASAFLRVEGGWNDGINSAVGGLMDVNGVTTGDEPIGVTTLWYEQKLLDERLRLRFGKLDVSLENFDFYGQVVAFDAMPYANDAHIEFLDAGLVNNAAVPFPAAGLGGMVLVEPVERWYVAAAGYDRNDNRFSTNWSEAFDDLMISVETGVAVTLGAASLKGSYYVGYWYSTFPDAPDGQGFYLGASQQVYREPDTDDQGFGLFARYGYADRSATGIDHFWSFGGQYQGPFPTRDRDILGLGWAQAFTSGSGFTAPYEGALELYYRARITPWFHLSPHVQYIVNPGSNDVSDATTLGLRGQITF
jgi:porin